jgi:hypothetical protein
MFTTYGNALIASLSAFLVGGSFISMALNDLTWLTFAVIASLDRISKATCAERSAPVLHDVAVTPRLALAGNVSAGVASAATRQRPVRATRYPILPESSR